MRRRRPAAVAFSRSVLAPALCLLVQGAVVAAPQVHDVVGDWTGRISDLTGPTSATPQRTPMELRIFRGEGSDLLVGTATYPELRCTTRLREARRDPGMVAFTEEVVSGGLRCARGGTVFVARDGRTRLQWLWFTAAGALGGDAALAPAATTVERRSDAPQIIDRTPPPATTAERVGDAPLFTVLADPPPPARDRRGDAPVFVVRTDPPVPSADTRGNAPVVVIPGGRPSQQDLEARAARIAQRVDALIDGPFTPFRTHSDVTATLAAIQRGGDATALAVANFAAFMPRFVDSEKVFQLAARQAARRAVYGAEVGALNRDYQAAMARMREDWDSMVIAVALQGGSGPIMRLAQRVAASPDRDSAARLREVLQLATSTPALREMLAVSARHADVYRRIENEYRIMADGETHGVAAQLKANDLLLVHASLGPNDLNEAQAEIARLERWRAKYLADVRRGALQSALGLLLGRDAGDGPETREARASDAAFEAARREREERRAQAAARERERDELDRQRDRMYEPNPLLPPAATIN